jgi:hypothetical protein
MRFLKTLTLNRRAIYDSRVALNTDNTFTVADSTAMVLPKSENSLTAVQTLGMIRYNTDTDDVEVYQGTGGSATWRALRFREPNGVTVQSAGSGNGTNTVFPLSPQPATYGANGVTWDVTQMAKNILVMVGNVLQIANSNYVVLDGANIVDAGTATPGYPYTSGTKYLQFQGAIPGAIITGEPVTVIHGLDQ